MTLVEQPRQEDTLIGHYAGFTSRLLAFILDTIILGCIIVFTSWFLAASWNMLQIEPIFEQLQLSSPILNSLIGFFTNPVFFSLVTVLFIALYHVFFWTFTGQTPGKGIVGLRIVPRRDVKLKLGFAVLRYLGYYLSILPFGLGILWILIDDRRLAWHDKIAGTCVIYAWEAKPDETFLAVETSKVIARTQALRSYLEKRRKTG
jgi:uncharacterized RDD family membrane protein YckC